MWRRSLVRPLSELGCYVWAGQFVLQLVGPNHHVVGALVGGRGRWHREEAIVFTRPHWEATAVHWLEGRRGDVEQSNPQESCGDRETARNHEMLTESVSREGKVCSRCRMRFNQAFGGNLSRAKRQSRAISVRR